MPKFRVGVCYEVGGFSEIEAKTEAEAEKILLERVSDHGEKEIEDVTHRDYWNV